VTDASGRGIDCRIGRRGLLRWFGRSALGAAVFGAGQTWRGEAVAAGGKPNCERRCLQRCAASDRPGPCRRRCARRAGAERGVCVEAR